MVRFSAAGAFCASAAVASVTRDGAKRAGGESSSRQHQILPSSYCRDSTRQAAPVKPGCARRASSLGFGVGPAQLVDDRHEPKTSRVGRFGGGGRGPSKMRKRRPCRIAIERLAHSKRRSVAHDRTASNNDYVAGTNNPATGPGSRGRSGRCGRVRLRVDGVRRPEKTFTIAHTNGLHSYLIGIALPVYSPFTLSGDARSPKPRGTEFLFAGEARRHPAS